MKVRILGTGGFDNEGLPFNSFVLDGTCLVEAPPDVVVSLARERLDPRALSTVFVSHCHGDHLFGLPFLLFRLWKLAEGARGPSLVGPAELKEKVLDLCAMAIAPGHPYLAWVAEACRFVAVREGETGELAGKEALFQASFHSKETLGFTLRESGRPVLCYIPDTRWDASLADRLAAGADYTLCDINGTGGFPGVHMSLGQVEEAVRALDLAGRFRPAARVLGTHVSRPLPGPAGRVGVASAGEELAAGGDPREALLAELAGLEARLGPGSPQAEPLSRIAAFVEAHPGALSRSCADGHITGSAFVVDRPLSRVLLVHHVKLDRWLQPGGHCEEGETPLEAAAREAFEETGLVCVPIAGGRLFDVDVHPIPARGDTPAHFHYDLRWLMEALPGEAEASAESHAVEWLGLDEAAARNCEESMLRPLARIKALARGEGLGT